MPQCCIETSELTMRYGSLVAVDHVSFSVEKGEVFGFLGPNGAGKSTTIKMLTTLLRPTSGKATVLGFDVVSEGGKIRPRIGVVQQEPSYEHALSVEGNLDMYGLLWNVPKKERKERIELLLDKFGLKEARKTKAPELSIGQRRRLQVAREFMHDSELMFLDEPTTGLDPQARRVTLDYVREKVKNGVTVFFTTHIMEEAEYVCDRIAIINHGQILALDTIQNVKHRFGAVSVIHVRFAEYTSDLDRRLQSLPGVQKIVPPQQTDEPLKLYAEDANVVMPRIIDVATALGARITELRIEEPSLDDVFVQMVNSKGEKRSEQFS
ncbi:MAG: ATP-binding cassette domain-containing protein [Candidatus Bathyarchaeia archaeon]